MFKTIHPAVYVTAGFFLIVLLQTLNASGLAWWAAVLLIAALGLARANWFRLLRRLRYIVLALLVLFAWQTPGIMVLPGLGMFSPTWDGLRAAIEPVTRLMAVVSVVALMLHYLTTESWVSSLYVLVRPLRFLGVEPERFAIRLRLVLDYVGQRELNWRTCLHEAVQDPRDVSDQVWRVRVLRNPDRLILVSLYLLFLGYLLW
jgi:hypothetical protein